MGVTWLTVSHAESGQRIDNYILRHIGGVPRSRIYKAIRKGEVRVNKKRVKADYKVHADDLVRLPPMRQDEPIVRDHYIAIQVGKPLLEAILYEDAHWLVVNKPAGISVHGGSKQHVGVIEALRASRQELDYLELGHRLDKDTSGCLLLAKNREALAMFHQALRAHQVEKVYHVLVAGRWPQHHTTCDMPLQVDGRNDRQQKTSIDVAGKKATTHFIVEDRYKHGTLIRAYPQTGRTHQIRAHAAYLGFPIIGDCRYGWQRPGWWRHTTKPRLMLHASELTFTLPTTGHVMRFVSPLPEEYEVCIAHLRNMTS